MSSVKVQIPDTHGYTKKNILAITKKFSLWRNEIPKLGAHRIIKAISLRQ